MVEVSTKVIATGIVGALGVVATTQVPVVQAAVRGAVNLSPDSEHVSQFKNVTNFIQEVATGQSHGQITTKSDVLREKGTKNPAIVTFKGASKHADNKTTNNIDYVASEAMTDALITSDQEDETTAYYDDSSTDTTETEVSTTSAEDAVVSEANSDSTQSEANSIYTIQDGDTLGQVAAANGISIADLQAANPGADTNMLQIGQSLNIPVSGVNDTSEAATYAAQSDTTSDTTTYAAASTDDGTQSTYAEPVQQSVSDFTVDTAPATFNSNMDVDVQSLESESTPNEQSNDTNTTNGLHVLTNGDVVLDALPAKQTNESQDANNSTSSNTQALSTQTTDSSTLTQTQRNDIVSAALTYASQNIPYVWGGKTSAGLDCSGLVAKAYRAAGILIPAYTVAEEAYVATQDVQNNSDILVKAQPGDLLFWGGHGATWQVAIYIGNGQYVIASEPGQQVQVANLADTDVLPDFIGTYNFH
ncbi:peptidoglycan endopeptidase [Weissella paramesenteroides]|uniref:C40 family peptidase n=1 Tax=Weissella paramesenteroides TaxID=1249 RepID=UPI00223BA709|nr:C40 family peptidase [Weissella paramesenteroides]MCS9984885.1 peptidoglycan endopeptidase [Weissella paramesenteroides]MCS9998889.1 peptidoglycan endopeptidase [Weissella paramesenteroides]MCT0260512.1 peptidoglycan endopeptidase [Weissella paramesenteroides]